MTSNIYIASYENYFLLINKYMLNNLYCSVIFILFIEIGIMIDPMRGVLPVPITLK